MKKLLLFIVAIGLFASSIYYMVHSEVYIGDVIGKIKVSEKYTPQNRNYECVDISFTYQTPNGDIHDEVLRGVDPHYLHNSAQGRRLVKERKYYACVLWLILYILVSLFVSISLFIIIIANWVCFYDRYDYAPKSKADFGCKYCGIRDFCYFENSRIHISETSKSNLKQFFGH